MQNVERDIIVIGAGGCGLMAALVAAKRGSRVLLLEKTDKPGGGTAFSSKGIRAAGSRRQGELKIDDSAALYAEDILRRNKGESDALLRCLVDHATNPNFQVRWTWSPGDVVLWDERCTQHFAVADFFPQRRETARVNVSSAVR